jgi:hypothetical protein
LLGEEMHASLVGLSAFFFILHASGSSQNTRWRDSWQMPSWMPDMYGSSEDEVPMWKRAVCKNVGHLARQLAAWMPVEMPGISENCNFEEIGGHYKLREQLQVEQAKSRHLERKLERMIQHEETDKQRCKSEHHKFEAEKLALLQRIDSIETLLQLDRLGIFDCILMCIIVSIAFKLGGLWQKRKITAEEKCIEDNSVVRASTQDRSMENVLDGKTDGIVGRRGSDSLGTDFSYLLYDEKIDQSILRCIKIQCPGVRHSDIQVGITFNGCSVRIARQASEGVEGTEWSESFEFKPEEGLFEFKEDQTRLEHGFLTLVFRTYTVQSRIFRFPAHFDLSADDEMIWDGHDIDKKISASHAKDSGLLENAATDVELEPEPVPGGNEDSTRTSIITEDTEATFSAGSSTVEVPDELSCTMNEAMSVSSTASDFEEQFQRV